MAISKVDETKVQVAQLLHRRVYRQDPRCEYLDSQCPYLGIPPLDQNVLEVIEIQAFRVIGAIP
jgi:hypothetical protein